jgi:small-conductance mechanosensitive channel
MDAPMAITDGLAALAAVLSATDSGAAFFSGPAGAILTQLVVALVIGVVTGLITANRMAAVLRVELRALEVRVQGLESSTGDIRADVADARLERSNCELRSTRTFASQGAVARVVSDQSTQVQQFTDAVDRLRDRLDEVSRDFNGRISGVHERVNEISQAVHKLGGPIIGG